MSKPKTYWEKNGPKQDIYDQLCRWLVPESGPATTRAGELMRSASKIYYDRYNNGWCNLDLVYYQGLAYWWLSVNGDDLKRHLPAPDDDRAADDVALVLEGVKRAVGGRLPEETTAMDAALERVITATIDLAMEETTAMDAAMERVITATIDLATEPHNAPDRPTD